MHPNSFGGEKVGASSEMGAMYGGVGIVVWIMGFSGWVGGLILMF